MHSDACSSYCRRVQTLPVPHRGKHCYCHQVQVIECASICVPALHLRAGYGGLFPWPGLTAATPDPKLAYNPASSCARPSVFSPFPPPCIPPTLPLYPPPSLSLSLSHTHTHRHTQRQIDRWTDTHTHTQRRARPRDCTCLWTPYSNSDVHVTQTRVIPNAPSMFLEAKIQKATW
jgi:hypothetical protein